jgi:hypothetical protein
MTDARGRGVGVGRDDLEVLGREGVDEVAAALERVDEEDRAVSTRKIAPYCSIDARAISRRSRRASCDSTSSATAAASAASGVTRTAEASSSCSAWESMSAAT